MSNTLFDGRWAPARFLMVALCCGALLSMMGCRGSGSSKGAPEAAPGTSPSGAGSAALAELEPLPGEATDEDAEPLGIAYPAPGTIFPAELPPPRFHWERGPEDSVRWMVTFTFYEPTRQRVHLVVRTPELRPEPVLWTRLKAAGQRRPVRMRVHALDNRVNSDPLATGRTRFAVSKDPVGAPIFYREVPLPFLDAYRDMTRIRWRLGSVGSAGPPPTVLENLPVCANCHSFSKDGRTLGMDVDYANDKGAYAVVPVEQDMALTRERIISWSDFRPEDGQTTFGLLSQVSPDGKHVVSTVKDRSLFVPVDDLEFSQLFFPVQGILAIYSTETRLLWSLPGADDPAFVQSNPSWTPDGQELIFARAPVQKAILERIASRTDPVLTEEQGAEFKADRYRIRYDLYRIPFADGKGGKAVPIPGASNNGRSNYFPRVSPDGRWIVFCQADRAMLLQPDSELYILPIEGGTPRRMRCNTRRMNSWHSWSPNGRWLVFASKAAGPYTQLYLAHVDEQGNDAPAVLLEHLSTPERAANIPEFAPIPEAGIQRIREQFMDDYSHARVGYHAAVRFKDFERAEREYERAAEINPRNPHIQLHLGLARLRRGAHDAAQAAFQAVLEVEPANSEALIGLGMIAAAQGDLPTAEAHLEEALKAAPADSRAWFNLAQVLSRVPGREEEAAQHYRQGLRIAPEDPNGLTGLGNLYARTGKVPLAIELYEQLLRQRPGDAGLMKRIGELRGEGAK